jgi:3-oxoacyl-[acyl-carrier-protein] synthase I
MLIEAIRALVGDLMHRVAITGIGIVSCLGTGVPKVGDALRSGRSGIVFDENRRSLGFRSPLTGAVLDLDPQSVLTKKHRKSMTDFAIQSYVAVKEAIAMSGLSAEDLQNEETGLVFGCDSTCKASVEQADILRMNKESKSIGSGMVFQSMNSTITMNLNTILKTRGASWTISSACSSGGHAAGQAADLIRLGRQERVICGGAQEINWESMCSFDALGAFSTRFDNPSAASRPFDKGRDGLVPSGGAAAVLLERYDLAEKRGAKILGELKGYAFSSDGGSLTVPDGFGLQSAMTRVLQAAEMKPEDIDYICAHATSTPVGDSIEAESITAIFGKTTPFVSSTKSMTGHELWMSGASQVVYSVIMAHQGFMAPNINFSTPDDKSARLNIITQTIERPPRNALCNSAGFGGTNSCLVIAFDQ